MPSRQPLTRAEIAAIARDAAGRSRWRQLRKWFSGKLKDSFRRYADA